jgi:hypothetical protein
MMHHGARPTQSTLDTLAKPASAYCETYINGKLKLGYLNARLPDPAFDYQEVALALVKVEGLKWYGTHSINGSGPRRTISTMGALRKAFVRSKADVSFQSILEEEQAKRGWQVGHPPMAQWIAWPGKPVSRQNATFVLGDTIEWEDDISHEERAERVRELLDLGADPCGQIHHRIINGVRSKTPINFIALTIMERDWETTKTLAMAGAPIDWDVCDNMASKWIADLIRKKGTQSDDTKGIRWKIGELLKAVGQCEPIDWTRVFPFHQEPGKPASGVNASWPGTWGGMAELCGGQLREEVEQACLRGTTPIGG